MTNIGAHAFTQRLLMLFCLLAIVVTSLVSDFALAQPTTRVDPKEFDVAATRSAAQAGDARMMGELGSALILGVGVSTDVGEGLAWLEKAAA